MKPHLIPVPGLRGRSEREDRDHGPPRRRITAPRVQLEVVRERQHTLALSGRLDHGSAHLLEAEIERMCEDGVTAITLDLRGLGEIDWAGIAVIAFRSAHCNRRGYHLEVIAGSEVLLAALTDAGVEHLVAREALDAAGEAQLQDRLSLG